MHVKDNNENKYRKEKSKSSLLVSQRDVECRRVKKLSKNDKILTFDDSANIGRAQEFPQNILAEKVSRIVNTFKSSTLKGFSIFSRQLFECSCSSSVPNFHTSERTHVLRHFWFLVVLTIAHTQC